MTEYCANPKCLAPIDPTGYCVRPTSKRKGVNPEWVWCGYSCVIVDALTTRRTDNAPA